MFQNTKEDKKSLFTINVSVDRIKYYKISLLNEFYTRDDYFVHYMDSPYFFIINKLNFELMKESIKKLF